MLAGDRHMEAYGLDLVLSIVICLKLEVYPTKICMNDHVR